MGDPIEIGDLLRRIEKLEKEMAAQTAPCVYEARQRTGVLPTAGAYSNGIMGVWCQRHGWDCPNTNKGSGV